MAFAIKAVLADAGADSFTFDAAKTMYGGRRLAVGDAIFLFARGSGLVGRGVATEAAALPPLPGLARQTPRVRLALRLTARPRRSLGRAEVKSFTDWRDGQPQTELNFKFYRQATDKLVGLSDPTAAWLEGYF